MKKKTLIIVGHPNIKESVINKRWLEELQRYPDLFTVHNIAASYPDGKIEVEEEQKLIEAHETMVWQYPFYNINCPAVLKNWIEKIVSYGWAFGPDGNKLEGKKFALAISTGGKERDFHSDGKYQSGFEQLLLPFKTIAIFTKMDYKGYFALHDSHNINTDILEKNAQHYIQFLTTI